VSVSNSKRDC